MHDSSPLGVEYDGMKRDGLVNSGLQKPLEVGGVISLGSEKTWQAHFRAVTPVNILQSLVHNLGIIPTNFDTELHPQLCNEVCLDLTSLRKILHTEMRNTHNILNGKLE
jgi:hypothetical protein